MARRKATFIGGARRSVVGCTWLVYRSDSVNRTHLFVALVDPPGGALLQAVRLAEQLTRAGDRVRFIGTAAVAALVQHHGFAFDSVRTDVLPQIRAAVARTSCAALLLIDIVSSYMALEALGLDRQFLEEVPVATLAIDPWDLDCTNGLMESGPSGWIVSPHSRQLTRRLLPSPMIRPTGWRDPLSAGVYNSLPNVALMPRDEARARLGIGPKEQALVIPFAHRLARVADAYRVRLTRRLPELIARFLSRLPNVRVIPIAAEREDFCDVLAAGDALLSFNALAPSIGLAALLGLPVLLGVNSYSGQDGCRCHARSCRSRRRRRSRRGWA